MNESFNGRFHDECLDRELLGSVLEARGFRDEYNTIQPHSTFDNKLPAEFRAELLRQASVPLTNHNPNDNQSPAQTLIKGGSEK